MKYRIVNRVSKLLSGERQTPFARPAGFDALYRSTYRSVYRYVFGLTGGPVKEVEDLAAETYLRAWESRERFHGPAEDGIGWLLRIARNLVIDRYRREGSRPALEGMTMEEISLPAATHTEEQVIALERQAVLFRLLAQLPDEQRELLVLRYLLGWKVRQIGRHVSMPENTVSVYIRRALEKLRALWPPEEN